MRGRSLRGIDVVLRPPCHRCCCNAAVAANAGTAAVLCGHPMSSSTLHVTPRSNTSPTVASVCPSYRSQKWSKGKVKEKLANLVLFDKVTYEKMLTDVPKQRLITPSIISEKLKVNGSLARKAVKELVSKNLIRPILTHKHQSIYTRSSNS